MRQRHDPLLVVKPSPERDPGGGELSSIITVQQEIDRLRRRRQLLLYLVVVLSVPVWIAAAWPSWHAESRTFSLIAWAFGAGALLATFLAEWRWERRRTRGIARLHDATGPLAVSHDPEAGNPPPPR